ncbi:hypothetical protein BDF14DRAFT_1835237 [Spinellus fusiger]|nr:hypothetical protein BDF14DRAFT_1835237 [Spinellus fusiger]
MNRRFSIPNLRASVVNWQYYPLVHSKINSLRRVGHHLLSYLTLKCAMTLALVIVIGFFSAVRVETGTHIFLKEWISPYTLDTPPPPLSHCFSNLTANSPYMRYGTTTYKNILVPGTPMYDAFTCSQWAGKIKRYPDSVQPTLFHTYWSQSITDFGEKQFDTMESFIFSQNKNYTKLIIWVSSQDKDILVNTAAWNQTSKLAPQHIEYRIIDYSVLVWNTSLPTLDEWKLYANSVHKYEHDALLRLLVLYHYGGVWFDIDTFIMRDFIPLLEHEWVSQNNCHTHFEGNPFSNNLLHFKKKSPYVCELLEDSIGKMIKTMAIKDAAEEQTIRNYQTIDSDTQDYLKQHRNTFGPDMYHRVYRKLLHHGIRPWTILPWCFGNPTQCEKSISLPSIGSDDYFNVGMANCIFAYHWHQQWNAKTGELYKYLKEIHTHIKPL